ncbi:hypothetical protein RS030_127 [Cryptosporidium xiaoi]|uniref:GRAM domain-containing protein n=1 Tax=Cryptosporidium xiaoi TaxID=659607 RepID=A0AAV9Y0D7_9CRYT
MSINPELMDFGEGELRPSLRRDEHLVMSRKSIRFSVEDENEIFKGSGNIYVTNKNLFIIKTKNVNKPSNFTSLCLPIRNIYNLKFEQPIFLASYLQGFIKPEINSEYPLSKNSKWWISFYNGGCTTFVRMLYKLYLKAMRDNSNFNNDNTNNNANEQDGFAFVDATDPTVIYIQE